jgi:hypothetical protein
MPLRDHFHPPVSKRTNVDLVTARQVNLYAEMLDLVGLGDPVMGEPPPPIYAASCRWVGLGTRRVLQTWAHVLHIGQPLPTLPLWLAADFSIPLNLEAPYEEACRSLRIP